MLGVEINLDEVVCYKPFIKLVKKFNGAIGVNSYFNNLSARTGGLLFKNSRDRSLCEVKGASPGKENLCSNGKWAGFSEDGTFSEYIILPERNLACLPKKIHFEHGALIGCAVVTTFHAMNIGGVKPGDTVAIIGVGQSKFDRRPDASIREITFEAYREAIEDAQITNKDVQASVICSATHYDKQRTPAGVIAEYLGLNPQPTFNVEAVCASSGVGLRIAWSFISSGLHDVVAVVGFQKMTELSSAEVQEVMGRSGDVMWESPFGTSMPGYFALYAKSHLQRYGTTEEQLAKVAVKNHFYLFVWP